MHRTDYPLGWTDHAYERLQQRFPGVDPDKIQLADTTPCSQTMLRRVKYEGGENKIPRFHPILNAILVLAKPAKAKMNVVTVLHAKVPLASPLLKREEAYWLMGCCGR